MSDEATLDEFVTTENTPISDSPNGVRLALDEVYPEDWGFAELNLVCKVNGGFTWNKEQETDSSEEGAVPVIKIGNVQDGYLDLTDTLYLKGVSDEELEKNKVRKDWLLMIGSNGSGERVGHSGLIEEDMEFVYASFLYGLRANAKYIIPRYLFYTLNRPNVQQRLTSFTAGSTSLKNLNKSTIENLSLPTPPLPEQRKIATVLYTVDRAIEKTESVIKQVERLEKGTIQALLSDGTRDSVTKKDTSIGEVPEHWDVRQVGNLTNVTVGYVQNIDGHFTNSGNGIQLYRTKDISSRGLQVQEESYVTQEFHENNKGSQLTTGDLIVARHGDSGQAAVIPESTPEAHCQNVVIVRSSDEFVPKFLEYLFNYEVTRQRLLAWKAGSVQKVVSTTAVQNFRVPLPPIEEQKEIVEKLSSINTRLENEDDYLQSLRQLKRGLMQDLLSGTVRTTDTNMQVPDKITQHG